MADKGRIMSRKSLIPLVLLGALVAAPAWAEEIIYFTNGTTMAVERYIIEENTVRVSLGGQAVMEFPLEQIEKIESGKGDVRLDALGTSNRMMAVPRTQASAVTGAAPSRRRGAASRSAGDTIVEDNYIDVGKAGLPVYRPFGKDAAPNKRGIAVTGRRELRGMTTTSVRGTGGTGAAGVGRQQVVQSSAEAATFPKEPVGLEAKPRSPAPKKKP
jgi:hypothetical protein